MAIRRSNTPMQVARPAKKMKAGGQPKSVARKTKKYR